MMKQKKSLIKLKKQKKLLTEKNQFTKQINIHKALKVFKQKKTFGEDIYNGTITLKEADDYQTNLLNKIVNFN